VNDMAGACSEPLSKGVFVQALFITTQLIRFKETDEETTMGKKRAEID
jgi:hypothetical protein